MNDLLICNVICSDLYL